jgi:hypothetical protein
MSRSSDACHETLTLPGGVRVAVEAVCLGMGLEARGCHVTVVGDGLVVGPRDRLTDADREALRRWRDDLRAVVLSAMARETQP